MEFEESDELTGPAEPGGAGRAVEALLEEVGEETQVQPAGHLGGFRGRTAIVTGGATGIGRRTAIEFARLGANVAFNWVDLPGRSIAEEAACFEQELQQLEVKVLSDCVDVRDAAAVNAFVERVRTELGGLHYLVNCAGVHRSAPLWKLSDEQWQEVIDVNLTGAFNMIRAVAPTLRAQRFGKIVNIASVHAFAGSFGVANYSASKSGLVGLTLASAAELGPANVNVNGVAPGYVRTDLLTDVPEEVVTATRERAALKRLPEAEDVAHVVLFLCSEMARQITGQVIRVDAGLLG
ncbi:MAG: 3-oxoacyl-ACP reductase FabG [Gemmatimonadota bacterium]|nr:MAG: 3-oxoacyl-ACP reductase FabG [Gemmatimonadota bacterium]